VGWAEAACRCSCVRGTHEQQHARECACAGGPATTAQPRAAEVVLCKGSLLLCPGSHATAHRSISSPSFPPLPPPSASPPSSPAPCPDTPQMCSACQERLARTSCPPSPRASTPSLQSAPVANAVMCVSVCRVARAAGLCKLAVNVCVSVCVNVYVNVCCVARAAGLRKPAC